MKKISLIALLLIISMLLPGCFLINNVKSEGEYIQKLLIPNGIKKTIDGVKKNVEQAVKEVVKDELDPQKTFGKRYLNIAFLGLDKTVDREETLGSFRTDTINILRLDVVQKKLFMFSIPRDTYVWVANKNKYDKINHAFPFGGGIQGNGFQNSIKTIDAFLGIKIDYYFGMDMEAIAPIVDAIGGVTYNVDVDYHSKGFTLSKGVQVLNGDLAQQYVRFRYSPMGDIDRVERQQRFLMALIQELKKKIDIAKGFDIYNSIKHMTYTDLDTNQITALAYFFKQLDEKSFDRYVVEGTFLDKNAISYWKPNSVKVQAKVKEVFTDK